MRRRGALIGSERRAVLNPAANGDDSRGSPRPAEWRRTGRPGPYVRVRIHGLFLCPRLPPPPPLLFGRAARPAPGELLEDPGGLGEGQEEGHQPRSPDPPPGTGLRARRPAGPGPASHPPLGPARRRRPRGRGSSSSSSAMKTRHILVLAGEALDRSRHGAGRAPARPEHHLLCPGHPHGHPMAGPARPVSRILRRDHEFVADPLLAEWEAAVEAPRRSPLPGAPRAAREGPRPPLPAQAPLEVIGVTTAGSVVLRSDDQRVPGVPARPRSGRWVERGQTEPGIGLTPSWRN